MAVAWCDMCGDGSGASNSPKLCAVCEIVEDAFDGDLGAAHEWLSQAH